MAGKVKIPKGDKVTIDHGKLRVPVHRIDGEEVFACEVDVVGKRHRFLPRRASSEPSRTSWPTPAPDRANPTVLEKHLEGVTFPDWSKKFGSRAEGARTDRLDGRRAETVFYTHHGHRIGYTVISGEPLEPPEGAQTIRRNGVEIHRYKDGDRTVVTFERGGLTCILSSHVVHADTPLKLAAWKGSGAIRF